MVRLYVKYSRMAAARSRVLDAIFTSEQAVNEFCQSLEFHGWNIDEKKLTWVGVC